MTPQQLAQALEAAAAAGRLSVDAPVGSPVLLGQIEAAGTLEEAVAIARQGGFTVDDIKVAAPNADAEIAARVPTTEEQNIEDRALAGDAAHRAGLAEAAQNNWESIPGIIYDPDTGRFSRNTNTYTNDGFAIYEYVEPDNDTWYRRKELAFVPIRGESGQSETYEVEDAAAYEAETSGLGEPPIDRSYLGFPGAVPDGFEPGLGVDPTDQERKQALNRIERTRRSQFRNYLGGRLAHEEPELNTFTDGGGLELRYYEGEAWQFSHDGANNIRILQERMERGGILKPGSYIPGVWDQKSVTSMQFLMSESNAKGITWEMSLSERVELMPPEMLADIYGSGSGSQRAPFVAPAYRAPDNASLSQAVKGLLRQRLRREPTARELAELTTQMDNDYRKSYDAEVSALRSEYNATTAAIDTDEAQSAGTVRSVDPTSRFREAFESKFAGEISLNEDSDDFIEQSAKMQGAMGRLDQMIGF